ncbi:pyridoxal phosphate-dependent aminotransferase [Chryseotalea sanaruensis]|uniref:GDP-perosamine synthase n=1 Tax=Chryseotalea sanaruensis TaxID=2482724 RepID=A0A401U6T1_9BACT|nr:aminotransferase class I/II-fold pyridoxal phosphate-dependent enzyme [Chryseotalea sanaruensis]GCC50587.1 pyridoxal phosphate-dependent aminotransferase [Chryseotalea sanaruensis]
MNERIYLSSPHMGGRELEYVQEAFATNWVAPAGPHLTAFEQGLSDYLHGYAVAALSSGTAAIHLALIILGVKQNDEVLCASFTFSGSCNPIAYLGAKPVFVDSEPETWNMDPALLEEAIQDRIHKIGKKPKAIIVVHLYGMPAKMDEIMAIARQHEIPVIEDAAEALGALYKGQKCGTFGDFGILSFNGNKIITTSGGGALVSKNSEWIEKARFLATQARDSAPHYQHSEIGYNYRLSNICAGIGRGQLEVLEQRVHRRREIFAFYRQHLEKAGINFQPEQEGSYANRWLTCVLLEEKSRNEKVRLALEKVNIETRPLWKSMHLQPVFAKAPAYENGFSADLFSKGLCLPSGSNLTTKDLEFVIREFRDALD